MEQFNTIPTSGNWSDIAGILDANFFRCYTALVQSESLVGLSSSNFQGIYTSASTLPEMSSSGWALVGSSLSALTLYVYNTSSSEWGALNSTTYNFTDFSEFQNQLNALSSQVATIGSKLDQLEDNMQEQIDDINLSLGKEVQLAADFSYGGYNNNNGAYINESQTVNRLMKIEDVSAYSTIIANVGGQSGFYIASFYDSSDTLINVAELADGAVHTYNISVPNGASYAYIYNRKAILNEPSISVVGADSIPARITEIEDGLTDAICDIGQYDINDNVTVVNNRYIKNDCSIVQSGNFKYYTYTQLSNAKRIYAYVADTVTTHLAISFYSSNTISIDNLISSIASVISNGTWLSLDVPDNAVMVAICNSTNILPNPKIRISGSKSLSDVQNLISSEKGILENEIATVDEKVSKYIALDYGFNYGGYNNNHGAYISSSQTINKLLKIENVGNYSSILATVGGQSGYWVASFYDSADNFMGVVENTDGTVHTYKIDVPSGASYAYIYNRTAILSTPVVKVMSINSVYLDVDKKAYDNTITWNRHKDSAIVQCAYHGMGAERTKDLCFAWGSDFHGMSDCMNDFAEYAESKSIIDFALNTGDTQQATPLDVDYLPAMMALITKPCLNVIGNHDNGFGADATYFISAADKYERYISRYLNNMGVVQPNDLSTYPCYYYKDFSDYGIRLIVADIYDVPKVTYGSNLICDQDKNCISEAQANFIANALLTIPSGYSAIIAMHTNDRAAYTISSVFSQDEANTRMGVDANMDGSPIADIVNAFVNSTTLSKTYTYTGDAYTALNENSLATSYTLTIDFTNALSNKFICYLFGHKHKDEVATINDYGQLALWVTTASYRERDQKVSDIARTKDNSSKDCFNVVGIDTSNRHIKIVRIGADTTMNMTERKMILINY